MSGIQYHKKFGLLDSTALKSKRIRLLHSKVMSEFRATGQKKFLRKFEKNNKESANRKGKPKAIESQNKYGVCDLQIMTKIINLAKKLKKTPTLGEVEEEYGGGILTIMHSRYGSYIGYCRDYLKMTPNFSSLNPKYSSKKSWRDHLLDVGEESMKNGNPLSIKKLLPVAEQKSIYKYFKSFPDYRHQLLKRTNGK